MDNTLVYDTGGRVFEPQGLLHDFFLSQDYYNLKGIFFQMGYNLKKAPWGPLGGLPWEEFCVSFYM